MGAPADPLRDLDVIAALWGAARGAGYRQASQVEQVRTLMLCVGVPCHRMGYVVERHADQLIQLPTSLRAG
ncbi:hypothetical protein D3C85_1787760 [compost metagenome]